MLACSFLFLWLWTLFFHSLLLCKSRRFDKLIMIFFLNFHYPFFSVYWNSLKMIFYFEFVKAHVTTTPRTCSGPGQLRQQTQCLFNRGVLGSLCFCLVRLVLFSFLLFPFFIQVFFLFILVIFLLPPPLVLPFLHFFTISTHAGGYLAWKYLGEKWSLHMAIWIVLKTVDKTT